MKPDRLSRELGEMLEAARVTAEALSLDAQLARDTVGRWIRGPTVPTLAALRSVEHVLGARLGCAVDLSAAARERRSARHRDRLSADGAEHGEIVLYLEALIRWLNADPWPQDARFGGPALTPAAIERRLKVAGGGSRKESDADDLAAKCTRLVVLGGPGSGKTWFARRTARLCAETALEALAAGAAPDEVELPLYTTCAGLFAAPAHYGIRRAVVASALAQLPDLGSSRVTRALETLFEDRDEPTLLVADSLDEGRGADDRIRLADTLPQAWRIVLTSRPSSWNRQLATGGNASRLVGVLRPLRYPGDVEPFITRWFAARPGRAMGLISQLRDRPALQQSATVPLILTFYCIIGGDQPIPDRRASVHAKVIRRMLTGRWRSSGDYDVDPNSCLETLRDWAWSAAASDPVSGIGTWADEFLTPPVSRSRDEREVLDHVAAALGRADADTGMTLRRFVHRSIQEHLVAEYVALRMTAEEAADELVNHLWYDPDWEYAASAALAMHPQRGQVLEGLIDRITSSDPCRADFAMVDSCWEIRRFLARVASESTEDDWPVEKARLIGQARFDLAVSGQDNLRYIAARNWPTSNRLIMQSLLAMLAGKIDPLTGRELAEAIAHVDPSPKDREQAQGRLLKLLATQTMVSPASMLLEGIIRLALTPESRQQARRGLLIVLGAQPNLGIAQDLADALTQLDPPPEERKQARHVLYKLLRTKYLGALTTARKLMDTVARLTVTLEEREQARQELLSIHATEASAINAQDLAEVLIRLDPSPEDRKQARQALYKLMRGTFSVGNKELMATIAQLTVTPEDRKQSQQGLLLALANRSSPWSAQDFVEAIEGLDPSPEDRREVRQGLLAMLANRFRPEIVDSLFRLDLPLEDRAQAWNTLLRFLLASNTYSGQTRAITEKLVLLAVAPDDRAQIRRELLTTLVATKPRSGRTCNIAEVLASLDPSPDDRAEIQRALLILLPQEISPKMASNLAKALTLLAVTPEDRAQARQALLTALAVQPRPRIDQDEAQAMIAQDLAETIAKLDPSTDDRSRVRRVLLTLIISSDQSNTIESLAQTSARLAVTPEDQVQARQELLALMTTKNGPWIACHLTRMLTQLDAAPADRAQARQILLTLLLDQTSPYIIRLAREVARLDPPPGERAQVRLTLLSNARLLRGDESIMVDCSAEIICQLAVTDEERVQTQQEVLKVLATGITSEFAWELRKATTLLAVAPDARRALLTVLTSEISPWKIQLAYTVTQLKLPPEERPLARQALLNVLNSPEALSGSMMDAVIRLAVTAEDRTQVLQALLALLTDNTRPETARILARRVARLDPRPEDQARARRVLLALLASESGPGMARNLAETLAKLNPTLADLRGCGKWPFPPDSALLAVVRQNTAALTWLDDLPLLARTARATSQAQ